MTKPSSVLQSSQWNYDGEEQVILGLSSAVKKALEFVATIYILFMFLSGRVECIISPIKHAPYSCGYTSIDGDAIYF